jgi:hypothetical protein
MIDYTAIGYNYAKLDFTSVGKTTLISTQLSLDITLLRFAMLSFTQLLSDRLCYALLGYNYALHD